MSELDDLHEALEEIQGEAYLWQIADGPYDKPKDVIEAMRKIARAALAKVNHREESQPRR